MKISTTYGVKIKHYNAIFKETVRMYREAVDFFLMVCDSEWDAVSSLEGSKRKLQFIEKLTHTTAGRPVVKYCFDADFYKFPSYLRRAAINEAVGKYSRATLRIW